MNVALLLVLTIPLFATAYFLYAGYIAKKIGLDEKIKTPAIRYADDRDFVPTKTQVLFGHHFASIAGAGPIIGPTIALLYGYAPVWLWIVLGTIFFGAVHDFTALFVSVRENGRSLAEVAGKVLGKSGFILFILFTIIMIVLVTSAFLGLTTKALTSLVVISDLGHDFGLIKTIEKQGVVYGRIGGIASTSVIFMTLCAPLIGFLICKKKINNYLATLIASLVSVLSLAIGFLFPITFDPNLWMVILAIYSFLAAAIPVWIILQPRDFTNVHILYLGIVLLVTGIIMAGLQGDALHIPKYNVAFANAHPGLGYIWPVLFITVACGAISGFHALIAGGTSSKQISSEKRIRLVGYGAMLLEGLLAVCVIIAVAGGLSYSQYLMIVFPPGLTGSNPILAFALGVGNILYSGLMIPKVFGTVFGILMVEGFVITSLDTAVRLNRYLFEELWRVVFPRAPRFFHSFWFNSGLSVAIMLFLAFTNAYITIWPIFGTANQLLAALALIAITAWLMLYKKPAWFTFIPAVFMLVTTVFSLLMLLMTKYLPEGNYILSAADLFLLILSIALTVRTISIFWQIRQNKIPLYLKHVIEENKLADEMHVG